jgi:hypothetical protein
MSSLAKALLVTALGSALAGTAAPALAGIHYKAVTRMEGPRPSVIEVEGWVSGENARVEFRQSENPLAKPGTYLITRDGGRTIYLVDPESKTYAEWNVDALLGMMGGIMNGGLGPLLKIEFSEPKVQQLLEEDGGVVAGQPTRHYRYRTSYTTKVKVFGMGRASQSVIAEDQWVTTRPQDMGLGVWLRSGPPHTGNHDFDQLLAAQWHPVNGFPMRTVSVSTSTDKNGKETSTRRTMEVTELGAASVPDSRFEMPAGYQERQLTPPRGRE